MPFSLSELGSNLLANIWNALEALFRLWHHVKDRSHLFYLAQKSRALHTLKTVGVLATLAFAAASLYYAKAAADDARCQLELQKRQYCEAAAESIKLDIPCSKILSEPVGFSISCCCGGPDTRVWELMLGLPYYQTYVRAYCTDHVIDSAPWWYRWGSPYSTDHLRPILWRFPDVYWIAEVVVGWAGSGLAVVSCLIVAEASIRTRRLSTKGTALLLVPVLLPFLLSSLLLCAENQQQIEYWSHKPPWTVFSDLSLWKKTLEPPTLIPRVQAYGWRILLESQYGRNAIQGLKEIQSHRSLKKFDYYEDEPYPSLWVINWSEINATKLRWGINLSVGG